MSEPSDYVGAMLTPLSISEIDADTLLEGSEPVREELSELAMAVAAIRALGRAEPDADFSKIIAAAAVESRITPIERFAAEQAIVSQARTTRAVQRLAIGAAALLVMVVGTSGLAYAANGAAPGDALYGLDRAFEALGIGDGGASERLDEAQALVASGEFPGGLHHAAEVVAATPAGGQAHEEINAAATRLAANPPEPNSPVIAKVAELLDYLRLATLIEDGKVDGGTVSGLARDIVDGGPTGVAPGHDEDGPGNAPEQGENGVPGLQNDETPPGNSGDAPGQGEDPPGNSGDAPGQGEDPPGSSGDAPGQGEDLPGNSVDAPGQGEDPPGPPDSTPGGGPPAGAGRP